MALNRILLVDDDPIFSLSLIRHFESQGFEVTSVDSGAKAVEAAKVIPPNLVFLNIYLEGSDALTVVHQIRELPHCQQVPIIALTSNSDSEAFISMLRSGCNDFVNKPIDFTALDIKLQSLALPVDQAVAAGARM